ncbi:integral membrane protein [Teratosphaeria destructans]|uniref:Integral membrane protein n=1 Tax=Teratosphaeria destructans TaxID=418781 RepID=A0A9W7SKL7_9PEZI|nr:integral membrane protein [Teratosphaeria destructans]
MARNTYFIPEREPLRNEPTLQLDDNKIHGPLSFLNPTQAHFDHVGTERPSPAQAPSTPPAPGRDHDGDIPAANIGYQWSSRNNRKGRHELVVDGAEAANPQCAAPPPTNNLKHIVKIIGKMIYYYPVWDISYDVAMVFTWGSIIWVVNAFFALLPYTNPDTEFPRETLYGGGITALIGATVFEIGSVLLMLEAVNEHRTGCFGWAVEQAWHEYGVAKVRPGGCTHHHPNKKNLVGSAKDGTVVFTDEKDPSTSTDSTPPGDESWVWWPSWHELTTQYFRDLGFLACSSQMFGATVFWISGFTALPGIYNHLSPISVLNGVYWVPQVVGGSGFIISGTLFMIETQKHWWQPTFGVLGWHIGLWNLIGGIGFTLCPIFGLSTAHWRELQASVSTFWGSWAFLIGSVIQLYESLDKHPVEKAKET